MQQTNAVRRSSMSQGFIGSCSRGSERGLPFSAKIVDNIQVFLAAEIFENEMTFNAISRTGAIVDSGIVVRRELNAGVK